MKFKAGDLVELIGEPRLFGCAPPPSAFGKIRGFVGMRHPFDDSNQTPGPWYDCEFGGMLYFVAECALRLIPGDDGRQVGDWRNCVWAPDHLRVKSFREFMDRQLERA